MGAFDLNLFKSIQSAAGLKAMKPAGNWRCLICKIMTLLFTFSAQKLYIFPSVGLIIKVLFLHNNNNNNNNNDNRYKLPLPSPHLLSLPLL